MPGKTTPNKSLSYMIGIANHPFFRMLRSGLVFSVPFFLAGSIALIINHMPLDSYQSTMRSIFGENWKLYGNFLTRATIDLVSLCISCSIGASLAAKHNQNAQPGEKKISETMTSLVSLSCFAVIMTVPEISGGFSPISSWSGIHGFAMAIIVSHLTARIFIALSRSKTLELKIYVEDSDAETSQVFECIIPAIITILAIALFKIFIVNAGLHSLQDMVRDLFNSQFNAMENPKATALLFTVGNQIAWFFGIHGPTLFDYTLNGDFATMVGDNITAQAQGLPLPHILNKGFFDIFMFIGGAGGTLSLVLAILIGGANNSSRRIAKYGIIPSLFNINELIIFGLPIVLNPVFLIPFVLTPVVTCAIAWTFIYFGIVPGISALADWTTPPLINAYVATGSIKGTLLQLLNIIVGIFIYLPFVRISDAARIASFEDNMEKVLHQAAEPPQRQITPPAGDKSGAFIRALGNDLEHALARINLDGPLQLEYLPRLDQRFGRITALESKLVWRHQLYGVIPDQVLLSVAQETNNYSRLGSYVLSLAVIQRKAWFNEGQTNLVVNIKVPDNLLENIEFISSLSSIMERQNVLPNLIEISVNAGSVLMLDSPLRNVLRELQLTGVRICIENYDTGQGSLLYLRRFHNTSLKLDAEICKNIDTVRINQEICTEIMKNCRNIDITTIADGITNHEQLKFLLMQGCRIFQGPLISEYIPADQCIELVKNYKFFDRP